MCQCKEPVCTCAVNLNMHMAPTFSKQLPGQRCSPHAPGFHLGIFAWGEVDGRGVGWGEESCSVTLLASISYSPEECDILCNDKY